jgi:hypothetical protein
MGGCRNNRSARFRFRIIFLSRFKGARRPVCTIKNLTSGKRPAIRAHASTRTSTPCQACRLPKYPNQRPCSKTFSPEGGGESKNRSSAELGDNPASLRIQTLPRQCLTGQVGHRDHPMRCFKAKVFRVLNFGAKRGVSGDGRVCVGKFPGRQGIDFKYTAGFRQSAGRRPSSPRIAIYQKARRLRQPGQPFIHEPVRIRRPA